MIFDLLPMDIDDDVFLYSNNNDRISISEVYKISPEPNSMGNASLLPYGSFNTQSGSEFNSKDKWHRRANLQVLHPLLRLVLNTNALLGDAFESDQSSFTSLYNRESWWKRKHWQS